MKTAIKITLKAQCKVHCGAGAAGLFGLPAAVGFGGVGIAAGGTASGLSAAGVAGTGGAVGGLVGNAVKDFLWLPHNGLEGVLVNSRKSRLNGKKMGNCPGY